MNNDLIALFGEAEKGEFHSLLPIHSIEQLMDRLGHPPEGSRGIDFAVQALLHNRQVLYVRVEEEGFSYGDYYQGLKLLMLCHKQIPPITALCLPGVGNVELIEAMDPVVHLHQSFLITSERDFYDYLTDLRG